MHNIPCELEESEIYTFCEPFGGLKKIYMLKDKNKKFLGDAVAECDLMADLMHRYREALNYQIAMEGLQDLPIYNDTVIKVEKPDSKWPGFPQRVSTVSSSGSRGLKSRSIARPASVQRHFSGRPGGGRGLRGAAGGSERGLREVRNCREPSCASCAGWCLGFE